jgi:hypothetical protein
MPAYTSANSFGFSSEKKTPCLDRAALPCQDKLNNTRPGRFTWSNQITTQKPRFAWQPGVFCLSRLILSRLLLWNNRPKNKSRHILIPIDQLAVYKYQCPLELERPVRFFYLTGLHIWGYHTRIVLQFDMLSLF